MSRPLNDTFVIGVAQQPASSFEKWRSLGINTLVDIPQWGGGDVAAQDAAWVAAANQAGMLQIRKPVGDLHVDCECDRLLAWSHPDEPDRTGINPTSLQFQYNLSKPYGVPWFINFDGSRVLNLQPNNPPVVTEATYRQYIAAADWLCSDVYPISGWDGAIDFFSPMNATMRLSYWGMPRPVFMYVECGRQNLPWLPNGGRSPTPKEVRLLVSEAIACGVSGVIYFPLQPFGGFQWDVSSAEVKAEIRKVSYHASRGW